MKINTLTLYVQMDVSRSVDDKLWMVYCIYRVATVYVLTIKV